MEAFFVVLAFARPILLIAAVIGFTILFTKLMGKIHRYNVKRRNEAIDQLFNMISSKSNDGEREDNSRY